MPLNARADGCCQRTSRAGTRRNERKRDSRRDDCVFTQEADDSLRTQSLTSARQADQLRDITRQLEEKAKENASLARQLEISLVDAKRAESEARDKSNGRDREFQSQVRLRRRRGLNHSRNWVARYRILFFPRDE